MQYGCLYGSFKTMVSYKPLKYRQGAFLATERCKVAIGFMKQLLILGNLDLSLGFIFGHLYRYGTMQKADLDSNTQHGFALGPSIMVGHHGPTPVVRVA